jgi:hypothetical protein
MNTIGAGQQAVFVTILKYDNLSKYIKAVIGKVFTKVDGGRRLPDH